MALPIDSEFEMGRIATHFSLTAPGLIVRPVEPADAAFFRCLSDATLRGEFTRMGLPEPLLAPLLAQQFHAQQIGYRRSFPQAEYFLIVEQGAAIGRLVVTIEQVEETSAGGQESDRSIACGQRIRALRLIDIALLPAAQGRCIGRKVIAALAVAARSIEARRLTLSVQMSNDRAQSLYRRLGFIDTGGEAYRHMMMPLT